MLGMLAVREGGRMVQRRHRLDCLRQDKRRCMRLRHAVLKVLQHMWTHHHLPSQIHTVPAMDLQARVMGQRLQQELISVSQLVVDLVIEKGRSLSRLRRLPCQS